MCCLRNLLLVLALGACSDPRGAGAAASAEVVRPEVPELLDAELLELLDARAAAVQAEPLAAEPRALLGLAYEANRLWSEAHACFAQARELEPAEPLWALHAAVNLQQLGRDDEALELLLSASEGRESAPVWQRLGVALLQSGDLAGARTAFERTVQLAPEACEGHAGLGEAFLAAGQSAEALVSLERAVALEPNYKQARYLLGLSYRAVGRLEEAQRELRLGSGGSHRFVADRYQQQLEASARGFANLLERGIQLLGADQPLEATRVLEDLRRRQPENGVVLVNLATAYQRLGRTHAALAVLEEAQRLHPDEHMIQINLAACCLAMGRGERALEHADRAVALAPDFAHAHVVRAGALQARADLEGAARALRTAAELDPRNPRVQEELGLVCAALELHGEALAHFVLLSELLPDRWEVHTAIGREAVLSGDLERARVALDEALRLAPEQEQVAHLAAELSRRLNERAP